MLLIAYADDCVLKESDIKIDNGKLGTRKSVAAAYDVCVAAPLFPRNVHIRVKDCEF